MAQLWKNKDPAAWEAVLDRYYDIVASIGKDKLVESERCELLRVSNLNLQLFAAIPAARPVTKKSFSPSAMQMVPGYAARGYKKGRKAL